MRAGGGLSTAPARTAAGTDMDGWEWPRSSPRCSEDARLPNLPRPAPAVLSLTLPVGERSRLENGRVSWREARRALRRVVTVPAPPPHARCRHRAGSCRPGHGPGPGRAAGGAPGACGNLSHGRVQSGRLRGRSERKNNSSGISPCGRARRWRRDNGDPRTPAPPPPPAPQQVRPGLAAAWPPSPAEGDRGCPERGSALALSLLPRAGGDFVDFRVPARADPRAAKLAPRCCL